MKKKIGICAIALITAFVTAIAFMPATTYASSAKKMYVYETYKMNDTVFVCGSAGIYKAKLRSGKVVSKTTLVKCHGDTYLYDIHKKGKYLYYVAVKNSITLKRVNIKTKKKKKLATLCPVYYGNYKYSIEGKKIYYNVYDYYYDEDLEEECEFYYSMCMKLNGKNKRSTSKKPNMKFKRTNKKGYRLAAQYKGWYTVDYLKTPKGKFYLGKKKESVIPD